jgi:hypothetical protein
MRIALFVRDAVVPTVNGHPEARRELQATGPEDDQAAPLDPRRAGEAAVGEKAMEAQVDPKNAEDIHPDGQKSDPVQLKNQGSNARAASKWQTMKPTRVSVFNFTFGAPSGSFIAALASSFAGLERASEADGSSWMRAMSRSCSGFTKRSP